VNREQGLGNKELEWGSMEKERENME